MKRDRKWNLVAEAAGGARLGGFHWKPPKPYNAQAEEATTGTKNIILTGNTFREREDLGRGRRKEAE